MILEGEELEPITDATEADLLRVFDEAQTDFGTFIILSDKSRGFIQSACVWEPTDECGDFLKRTDSDPYCLEYKDEATGELFAAEGWFSRSEIKDAFVEYLRGTERWKENKAWREIEY